MKSTVILKKITDFSEVLDNATKYITKTLYSQFEFNL